MSREAPRGSSTTSNPDDAKYYVVNEKIGKIDSGPWTQMEAMERAMKVSRLGGKPKVMTRPRIGDVALDPHNPDHYGELRDNPSDFGVCEIPRQNPSVEDLDDIASITRVVDKALKKVGFSVDDIASVKFTRGSMSRAAWARFVPSTGEITLAFNKPAWAVFSQVERLNLTLHETAHAIRYLQDGEEGASHDHSWKKVARTIGCDGEQCLSLEASHLLHGAVAKNRVEKERKSGDFKVGDEVTFKIKGVGGRSVGVITSMSTQRARVRSGAWEGRVFYRDMSAAKNNPADDRDVEDRRSSMRGRSVRDATGKRFVHIYRAVNADENTLHPMDYVTLSRKFAVEHAQHSVVVDEEDQHVLILMAKAADVYEAPNPGEYFYDGPPVVAARHLKKVYRAPRANPAEAPCIRVLSHQETDDYFRAGHEDIIGALMSIGDPGQKEPWFLEHAAAHGIEVLRLEFADVEDGGERGAPDDVDIDLAVNFFEEMLPLLGDRCLVIHCELGIYRSGALAQIAYESLGYPPGQALDMVREDRPQADPSPVLMELYRARR